MNIKDLLAQLHSMSNPKNVEGQRRFGITPKTKQLGIGVTELRKVAREIKKKAKTESNSPHLNSLSPDTCPERSLGKGRCHVSRDRGVSGDVTSEASDRVALNPHHLALQLWATKIHEARILATIIADPDQMDEKTLNRWLKDFDSWDIVDQACISCLSKMKNHYKYIPKWAKRKPEFEKRSAFALLAISAWKNKEEPDITFTKFFPLLIEHSTDDRKYVKKAVNWALRQMGKRNHQIRKAAITCANDMLKTHPESKSAKWIAKDALRELSN